MRRAALRRASFSPALMVLGMAWTGLIGFTPALWAQPSSLSTVNGMGSYKDPVQRAAGAYSRGMKAKRKAEQEKDLDKRRKLLEEAKAEFGKSVAYTASYDSLLALGQVELALGERSAALQSCTHALSWKPADPVAVTCQNEARQKTVTEVQVAVTPGEPAAPAAPTEPAESKPPR
jgi:hypothetical protein